MKFFVALGVVVIGALVTVAVDWGGWWLVGQFFDTTPIGIVEMFFLAIVIRAIDNALEWFAGELAS